MKKTISILIIISLVVSIFVVGTIPVSANVYTCGVGKTKQLRDTGYWGDGSTTTKSWTSLDMEIASIQDQRGATCLVYGKKVGTVTISCRTFAQKHVGDVLHGYTEYHDYTKYYTVKVVSTKSHSSSSSSSNTTKKTVKKNTTKSNSKFKYELIGTESIKITGRELEVVETIKIPSKINGYKVKKIGKEAFSGMYCLKKVTIPNSVVALEDDCFNLCGLKQIKLPSSLKTIGKYAFYSCDIKKLSFPKSLKQIGKDAFSHNCIKRITIPGRVKKINGFAGNYFLKSVTIKKGAKRIKNKAFYDCPKLSKVNIPKSVKVIEKGAFSKCKKLKKVTISKKTKVAKGAFPKKTKIKRK